jgi:dTDP-4-dehydrorhamnose reductase
LGVVTAKMNWIFMSLPLSIEKRILVLGASGFLGSNLRQIYSGSHNIFFASSSFDVELSPRDTLVTSYDTETLLRLVDILRIDVILNCVGFTDVEACESNPILNKRLNLDLPIMLDTVCRKTGAKLIQISTDHYSSDEQIPRDEEALMIPVNQYGSLKLQADKVLLLNPTTLVVRTNFFGFNPSARPKLLDWAKERLENGETVEGFNDVYFTPISVSVLGSMLMRLIDLDEVGLIHAVGQESLSKFEFLRMLSDALSCEPTQVISQSIKNSFLQTPRPNFLSLSNSKLIGILPEYSETSLTSMIKQELSRFKPFSTPLNV